MVVLPPPTLAIGPLTNKFEVQLIIKWGEFSKEVKISREVGNLSWNIVQEVNKALLEGSESKPYILQ